MNPTKLVLFFMMMLVVFLLFVIRRIVTPTRNYLEGYFEKSATLIRYPLFCLFNICNAGGIIYIFQNVKPLPMLEHPIIEICLLVVIFVNLVWVIVIQDRLAVWMLPLNRKVIIFPCVIAAVLSVVYIF